MGSEKKLVVTYPPEYDGELWVHTEVLERRGSQRILAVSFTVAMNEEETPKDTVRRISKDLARVG